MKLFFVIYKNICIFDKMFYTPVLYTCFIHLVYTPENIKKMYINELGFRLKKDDEID